MIEHVESFFQDFDVWGSSFGAKIFPIHFYPERGKVSLYLSTPQNMGLKKLTHYSASLGSGK